jgi:hypothetical protein
MQLGGAGSTAVSQREARQSESLAVGRGDAESLNRNCRGIGGHRTGGDCNRESERAHLDACLLYSACTDLNSKHWRSPHRQALEAAAFNHTGRDQPPAGSLPHRGGTPRRTLQQSAPQQPPPPLPPPQPPSMPPRPPPPPWAVEHASRLSNGAGTSSPAARRAATPFSTHGHSGLPLESQRQD